jgi:hypothetical protein
MLMRLPSGTRGVDGTEGLEVAFKAFSSAVKTKQTTGFERSKYAMHIYSSLFASYTRGGSKSTKLPCYANQVSGLYNIKLNSLGCFHFKDGSLLTMRVCCKEAAQHNIAMVALIDGYAQEQHAWELKVLQIQFHLCLFDPHCGVIDLADTQTRAFPRGPLYFRCNTLGNFEVWCQ